MASGPWDSYQAAPAAPAASGPWENFQPSTPPTDHLANADYHIGRARQAFNMLVRGADWVSHLGQPQAAKDLVQKISNAPTYAPETSQQLGHEPGLMEPVGGQAMTGPSVPPWVDARPVAAGAVDMATSPVSYAGSLLKIPTLLKGVRAIAEIPAEGVTSLASELTGVSKPALKMASTGVGREALQLASGQQGKIAENLVDAIDHFEKNIPEAQQVARAVKSMPKVNIQPAVQALEDAKPKAITGALSPEQQTAANKIEQYVDFLKGKAPNGQFFRTKYPAEDALELRRVLDSPIDYATGLPNPKEVQGALFKARQALKDELVNTAQASGNPEYKQAMSAWANKLDLLDDVKNAALGAGNDYSKQSRATYFLNGLFGKGVTAGQKQELIGKLDQVFGSDFLEQSKNARYAAELGDGGKASLMPNFHTGRAALGAATAGAAHMIAPHSLVGNALEAAALGLSSPAIATRAAIPLASLPPKILDLLDRSGAANMSAALPMLSQLSENTIPFRLRNVAGADSSLSPTLRDLMAQQENR